MSHQLLGLLPPCGKFWIHHWLSSVAQLIFFTSTESVIGCSYISPDFFFQKCKIGTKTLHVPQWLRWASSAPVQVCVVCVRVCVLCVCVYVCVHVLRTSVTPLGLLCTCSGITLVMLVHCELLYGNHRNVSSALVHSVFRLHLQTQIQSGQLESQTQ